jgi:D-arabinose 5-phosphate isomerase GutQ
MDACKTIDGLDKNLEAINEEVDEKINTKTEFIINNTENTVIYGIGNGYEVASGDTLCNIERTTIITGEELKPDTTFLVPELPKK